ncbi:hypothetical protein HNR25_005166 [Streptomonospora salina]|uniref:Uncharacterized protein n=1 Tax=Streptomonospora salina TaxID=104205 RepID=A0A841EDX1_9ACTN|nr:hypothetical protein [Streptomonospora salina]MBB6001335.1 hypothetical protein [Streptomonospora salina]
MAATAPCYAGGQWSQIHDFFDEASTDDRDLEDALKAAGFAPCPWSVIGDKQALSVPLSLTVFARTDLTSDKPHFLVQAEGDSHGPIANAFVQTLPDLMELLSRWAPAVQSAAVTAAVTGLHEAQHPPNKGDTALTKALRQFLS